MKVNRAPYSDHVFSLLKVNVTYVISALSVVCTIWVSIVKLEANEQSESGFIFTVYLVN